MQDYIIRAMAGTGSIRAFAATTMQEKCTILLQ